MKNNLKVGRLGENLACEYLVNKKRWKVLERNYQERWDEIDLICMARDGTLAFVEVKTLIVDDGRQGGGLMPEDNLTPAKLKKLRRASQAFAAKNPNLIDERKGWRIDLVAVSLDENGECKEIRYYENI